MIKNKRNELDFSPLANEHKAKNFAEAKKERAEKEVVETERVEKEKEMVETEMTEMPDHLETTNNTQNDNLIDLDFEDLNEDIEENVTELKEVNLSLPLEENNLETMQLKKPNQVYFELYKEARNKAKLAKKNALLAYLEAKNIKKTYLLDNLNDSDSEFDAEIDDVSESELDGL
jgi:hypothetical protein